ncbi:MAG TPA: ethanolamine ammonia-lyase subunit EutC [Desulfomicrobiaceae bacterium]|nr:ethanolamine ammonia-lyase subunit EutC [Desulfomicrobiaceae bacterium]
MITRDIWNELRQFTDARISLGRCGSSLPLHESLAFKLDHARARDAVWLPMDLASLSEKLDGVGLASLHLASSVADRNEFLTRPDKGRQLDTVSGTLLQRQETGKDICVVVGDGLSARAIHENGVPFLTSFMPLLHAAGLTSTPICLVENARVAIGDEIAHLLDARMVILLIGERPGLSSPNSMGIYMTFAPKPGTTDESRNCISNIRFGGLSTDEGVRKLAYLVENSLHRQTSGVMLKDRMAPDHLPFSGPDPVLPAG